MATLLVLYSIRGYFSEKAPFKVKKKEDPQFIQRFYTNVGKTAHINRTNFRLTLFTSTSMYWIYEGFYDKNGNKVVPSWISSYLSPVGLAALISQDGNRLQNHKLL